jgi:hypothetical protein
MAEHKAATLVCCGWLGRNAGDATSTVRAGTFDINSLLGADRYYQHATPIIGQNTITTNLEEVRRLWPAQQRHCLHSPGIPQRVKASS